MSFKEKITLDLRTTAFHELPENIISSGNDIDLLKSIVIYGANASGKSNLIKALSFFKEFAVWSYKNLQADEKIDVLNFVLNEDAKTHPSFFEIVLMVNNVLYKYGFEVSTTKVIREWLHRIQKTKEESLFERNSEGYTISEDFNEGRDLKTKTRDNCLFLSVVSQFNGEISLEIIKCIKRLRVSTSLGYRSFYLRTLDRLGDDPSLKQDILKFVSVADNHIKDFVVDVKEDKAQPDKPGIKESIRKLVFFMHEVFNDKKESTGKIGFGYDFLESEGTKKMFALSVPIIDALKNGEIIVIDELESHLHPLMLKHIIKLFNSYSNTRAQLIFATHNLTCMNKECFRRDQIWFTEKNGLGESNLFSLADYKNDENKKVRNDASYSKDYLQGKYGAVPFIKEIDLSCKEN